MQRKNRVSGHRSGGPGAASGSVPGSARGFASSVSISGCHRSRDVVRPRIRRALIVLAAVVGLIIPLAACQTGSSTGTSSGHSGDTMKVAVIAKGYSSPFWAAVKAGAMAAGEDLGVTVTFNGPDNESDIVRQDDLLYQMLVTDPSALVFAALDSQSQENILLEYQQAGIPVIAFDSGVPGSDIPVTTVATNNTEAAAAGAEHMSELLGGTGKIAILCHSETSASGQDRENGFRQWIEENAPGIEIIDVQYNNSDQAVAQQQAAAIIQANPDLVGLFSTDDDGSVAAAQAVQTAGLEDQVTVVGFDSGAQQKQLIMDGVIAGSITQNPYQMGYDAVTTAIEAAQGTTGIPSFTDSGYYWYDSTNMADEEIAKALYD